MASPSFASNARTKFGSRFGLVHHRSPRHMSECRCFVNGSSATRAWTRTRRVFNSVFGRHPKRGSAFKNNVDSRSPPFDRTLSSRWRKIYSATRILTSQNREYQKAFLKFFFFFFTQYLVDTANKVIIENKIYLIFFYTYRISRITRPRSGAIFLSVSEYLKLIFIKIHMI